MLPGAIFSLYRIRTGGVNLLPWFESFDSFDSIESLQQLISLSRDIGPWHSMAASGKHDNIRTRTSSEEFRQGLRPGPKPILGATADEGYMVACPEHKQPFSYIWNLIRNGGLAQTTAPDHVYASVNNTTNWQLRLSVFFMQTMSYLRSPMATIGRIVELTGSTIVVNGGLMMTLFRFLCSAIFLFKKGPLVVPSQDSSDYLSGIGLLDPRRTLLGLDAVTSTSDHTQSADPGDTDAAKGIFPGPADGDRTVADVMLLAARFAYENEALVKEVVTNSWKMNFVGMYNCWNEFQQRWNKQVYVFTDRAQDANAIVVAWKGTAPFNADDWSMDTDFSWYDLQDGAGKVHVGFMEVLGLGDRHDMNTFTQLRKHSSFRKKQIRTEFSQELTTNLPGRAFARTTSGLPQEIIDDPGKILAYDYIRELVKELLEKNPNAKLFITGHSLGGALAMLFAGMLYYFGERSTADRIAAVYTFGQPRVGDEQFCTFMRENLSVERYFRVVYANDIVPRLPFDNPLFKFKHWGLCFYFSRIFAVQTLEEAPDPNFFNMRYFFSIHANAVLELMSSLTMGYVHGSGYQESIGSFLFRLMALFLPGFGGHSPVNYTNALRLGNPMPLVAKVL